jgi:hypothetical protein
MRGADSYTESLFSTVRLEEFVPADHPLREIRLWVNEALSQTDSRFSAMYEADIISSLRPREAWSRPLSQLLNVPLES